MIPQLENIYACCELCPRRCRVDRSVRKGYCGSGTEIRAAKAMLHPWEEPALGLPAGTVFFSGCTLGCVYCQNYKISHEGFGKALTEQELAETFLDLQEKGARNIDLVTPTHYLPGIIQALDLCKPKLKIPIVCNCGGYERKEILELLEDYVDIWLPDIKYYSDDAALKYSNAPAYFETALTAVEEMLRQVRKAEPEMKTFNEELSADGKTPEAEKEREKKENKKKREEKEERKNKKKKLILRHMVLPGQKEDSIRLLRELACRIGTEGYYLSLMSQYTPFYKAAEHPEINRRLTSYEYDKVLEEALRLGFDGFMQERTSAKEEYTPDFDLSGLPGTVRQ